MKYPCDQTGKPLVVGGYYTGYNRGVYQLIDCDIRKHENISIVVKVVSGRGVAILNPSPRSMGNGWLKPTTAPTICYDDPTGYWQAKRERIQRHNATWGKKMVVCVACNGSGRYDHNRSPKCSSCDGTGKCREV